MGAEEKGSHKERVEAMQKKFDVSDNVSWLKDSMMQAYL